MRLLLLMVALVCTSCHHRCLKVRSEYLKPSYLASERIESPDPFEGCFYGQQIIARWHLDTCHDTSIVATVRFGDRSVETFSKELESACGTWTLRFLNEMYFCKKGILSYKVELFSNGEKIDAFYHALWCELIELS